jgi:hypothetical protein
MAVSGPSLGEWRPPVPSVKATRRRIVCPTLTGGEERTRSLSRSRLSPERSFSSHTLRLDERPAPSMPLAVGVRVLYFSRDGSPADTGDMISLSVSTSTTVEALLRRVRETVGCGEKGRLLFKMRPLADPSATLEMCGIPRDPQGLHLMLSRKERPPEVADKAAHEAAELSSAMAAAAAEAALRGPRQKREPRPPSGGSVVSQNSNL